MINNLSEMEFSFVVYYNNLVQEIETKFPYPDLTVGYAYMG